ncbi:MAG: DNA polymerase III subunit gamma/tau [Acidimicrobiales bacterium]
MAYQSLYRRYRPQRFSELRGQEHLVAALQNAVREDRVGHAYLFSGPRGTGKTSSARILAKVLNCENPIDGEPCGVCESCVSVEQGTSFDVHELDAASNNGVDAIRELIAKSAMGTPGRTKVYILDEVHMLSTPASNALLKTLEEPPPHVVFVLATTDPQKVLPTIRSRTQHCEVRLLSCEELAGLAEFIIADAQLDVPPGAVDYVVRAGAGSARDMESALDQVVAAGGLPDDGEALDELVEALCERDTARALIAVDAAISAGRGPRVLGELLIGRLRDVFLASMKADLSRLPDRDQARVTDQAARLGPAGATRALEVLGEAFVGIQDAPDQRIPLEVALVRLTRPEADTSLAALAERVARLERGGPPAAQPAQAPATAAGPAPAPVAAPAPAGAGAVDAGAEVAPVPAADHGVADEVPDGPPVGPGGRPSAGAREALQAKKQARAGSGGRSPAARPSAAATPPPAPSTASVAPPAPSAPAAPAPSAAAEPPSPAASPAAPPAATPAPTAPAATAPTAGTPPADADASGLPTRDELTLAWGDSILASLPPRAKAFYAAGRFLEVSGKTAVFGLPNAPHMQRCESGRADVEAALARHFGRPVPLRLAVDDDSPPSTAPAGGPSSGADLSAPPPVPDDEAIDPSELVDATDVASTSVDRVKELFPGAELVDPS